MLHPPHRLPSPLLAAAIGVMSCGTPAPSLPSAPSTCLSWHGPPVRVAPPGSLSQFGPQVVWTSSSQIVVGFRSGASAGPVVTSALNADLSAAAPPQFATGTGTRAVDAVLVPHEAEPIVVWSDDQGLVYARHLDARGASSSPASPILSVLQGRPASGGLRSSGKVTPHTSWATPTQTGDASWALAPVLEAGTLLVLPPLSEDESVQEVVNAGEATWLAWRTKAPGLRVSRWTGEQWSPEALAVSTPVTDLVGGGSDARFSLAWRDPAQGTVYAGIWMGDAWSTPPRPMGEAAAAAEIASNGEVDVLAWPSQVAEQTDLQLRVLSSNGEDCAATPVHPRTRANDRDPALALRAMNGRVEGVIVWERLEADGLHRLWGRRFSVDEQLATASPSPPAEGQEEGQEEGQD